MEFQLNEIHRSSQTNILSPTGITIIVLPILGWKTRKQSKGGISSRFKGIRPFAGAIFTRNHRTIKRRIGYGCGLFHALLCGCPPDGRATVERSGRRRNVGRTISRPFLGMKRRGREKWSVQALMGSHCFDSDCELSLISRQIHDSQLPIWICSFLPSFIKIDANIS